MSDNSSDTPRKRSRRWLWWAGALVVVVGLIAWAGARPPQVTVAPAEMGDLSVTVTATGDVEGRVADLSPTLQGRFEAIYREEGAWVQRGDLLARIVAAPAGVASTSALTPYETIEAPFDGVVSRRRVDPGDPAIPGRPAFQVTDTANIWITALIDDIDVAKVHKGQDVQIMLPSYLGRSLPGVITHISATATPRTEMGAGGKVVRTRVELTEGAGPLRPGMEVDVSAQSVIARDVLLIPADAVIEDETGRYVLRVEDGRVRRTEVEIGANNYVRAQVLSGLSAGDEVVVDGKDTVDDGDRVRTAPADVGS